MEKQVFLLLLLCIVSKVFGNAIVDTKSGKIEGKEINSIIKNKKYYSFFGIPYAEAPVGKLRFMVSSKIIVFRDILLVLYDFNKLRHKC